MSSETVELRTAKESSAETSSSKQYDQLIEIDWKNRKLPHSGVTLRKGRDIEILYDAEIKDITCKERMQLLLMCHTHQKERSYLLIREDGIDSNFSVQPCCRGCCGGIQKQGGFGNGYGKDCFRHTAFDSYDFNNACHAIFTPLPLACGASGQFSKIDVIDSGFMFCGKKICESKSIVIVPFEELAFPWCCISNRVNKCCNCCNCCGRVEGAPLCFKPWTGMQPENPEEFVEVLKKRLPGVYFSIGKFGTVSPEPSLEKEIPWQNRKTPHNGAIARSGKNIKILYDAEINDANCANKCKTCLCGGLDFDVNRSYVYIREDGIEWNTSYQPCCGIKCCGICGDEKSTGCAFEDRSVMHWDSLYLNSALKLTKFQLPDFVKKILDYVPYGNFIKALPFCCLSSEIPKLELIDSTVYICGSSCRPCAFGLCKPGIGEKSIAYFPFEICPFPFCCMRNRVNNYLNCCEKCGFATDKPILAESFEEKFGMPEITNPEEFIGVMAGKFPEVYRRKKICCEKEQQRKVIRYSTDKKPTTSDDNSTSETFDPATQKSACNNSVSIPIPAPASQDSIVIVNNVPASNVSNGSDAVVWSYSGAVNKVQQEQQQAVQQEQQQEQSPNPKQVVAKENYEKIYALLLDDKNAVDHALVLQHLSNISCGSAEDLEYFEDTDYDKFVDMMKSGVPKKKLLKLLNR